MKSPFDCEISAYFKSNAPQDVRQAIKGATKGVMLDPAFPHRNRLKKKPYQTHYDALQIELAKFQSWVKEGNQRVAIIFEGRDAAGKGGAIKRLRENLNPRVAKVVATRWIGRAQVAYDEVLAQIMRDDLYDVIGISEKKMFGGIAFMYAGHMVCGTHKDGAMF